MSLVLEINLSYLILSYLILADFCPRHHWQWTMVELHHDARHEEAYAWEEVANLPVHRVSSS